MRRSGDCSWVPVQGLQPADDLEKKKRSEGVNRLVNSPVRLHL